MKNYCLYILLLLSLNSCFKEKPIKLPPSNIGTVFTALMGVDYDKQLYFNLQSGSFVDSNSRFDYDLAFDCDAGKFNIWMNGAKLMLLAHSGKTSFDAISSTDTLNKSWQVEFGYGLADSNAIGKWGNYPISNNEVYLLNLGVDDQGNNLGYKKLAVKDFKDGYNIVFANLDGSDLTNAIIAKDQNVNFVYYSFNSKAVKHFEPVKDNWDFIFTMYSTYFYKEHLPYKVTGILTNPTKTHAYLMDSTSDFSKITIKDVDNSRFTIKRDGVGYEWKRYEYGEYIINTKYNYIIVSDDRYFKLRMLDFYDAGGSKGYPKFEYQELK